jgi:putative endonuclease
MYYYLYILASYKKGTLYVGVTSDLIKRFWQHKTKAIAGFTSNYNVINLIYYEQYTDIQEAILREKRVKRWKRSWKIQLIESLNPEWRDLYGSLLAQG